MLWSGKLVRMAALATRVRACCRRHLHWSSRRVRNTFIEYFKDLGHHHVRSSPVIPWNDPTLAFVNAGMNQFKGVFLGETQREYARATSSQKCIRVGGKHNDLAQVGTDTFHHTFFEMLGSWSFADYFKKDACSMAWKLLTEVYKLPPNCLYITYFGGDDALGLEADKEVEEIWRSIGVPSNRIIPFGMKDNFWEMGMFGPCGPCTEIHYDRRGYPLASHRVNLGVEDVIELWNIVFIQYERLKDCSLQSLGTHYVDTGMGLERLTATLNGKTSNYDTDLFIPIFSAIAKISGKPAYTGRFTDDGQCLDTAYRILADHMRMLTVALADGMFPEDSHKLRRIIRRAINVGKNQFCFTHGKSSLIELTKIVAENLGEVYPELCDQLARVHIILEHEENYLYEMQEKLSQEWKDLLLKRPELKSVSDLQTPGLIDGIKEITSNLDEWKNCGSRLPGHMAFKLYDTYGLHYDLIEELAEIYNLSVDQQGFYLALTEARLRTKMVGQQKLERDQIFNKEKLFSDLKTSNIPITDDSFKYQYKYSNGNYEFMPIKTKVLLIFHDGKQVEKSIGEGIIGVILEATNFYHEAGGQEGDIGRLCTSSSKISITHVDNVNGYIVHWGVLEEGELCVGDMVTTTICETRRMGCMQNHSATHLLNSAIRAITGLSCQKSSHVGPDHFYLQVRTYQALDHAVIRKTEDLVKRWIAVKSPINRRTANINEMFQEPNICLLPGEVYPDTVHIISTKLIGDKEFPSLSSTEPCCGTHLSNTGDIGNFVIINVNTAGIGNTRIRCVCGETATEAEANALTVLQQLEEWQMLILKEINTGIKERLSQLERDLQAWYTSNKICLMPYLVHAQIIEITNNSVRLLRNALRGDANKEMVNEMKEVISVQQNRPVMHLFKTDFGRSKAALSKATVLAGQRPVLVLAKSEGIIKGRSIIPEEMLLRGASASAWMTCVSQVLGGKVAAPRSQNPLLVCNFRSQKIDHINVDSKLREALKASEHYISKFY